MVCLLLAILINIGKFFEVQVESVCWDLRECGCGSTKEYFVKTTGVWDCPAYVYIYASITWMLSTEICPLIVLPVAMWSTKQKLNQLRHNSPATEDAKSSIKSARSTTTKLSTTSDKRASANIKTGLTKTQSVMRISNGPTRNWEPTLARYEHNMTRRFFCYMSLGFIITYSLRLIASCFELFFVDKILFCRTQGLQFSPIWFLYLTSINTYIQVLCASLNICWVLLAKI